MEGARTAEHRRRGEKALFTALGRSAVNGPVSRYINKPISLVISRYLVKTPLTPNQMTLIGSGIGFLGLWFVLHMTWQGVAIGCTLLNVQSILDGCDGEIARLKFKSSRIGAFLDHIADDVSTISFGLALGWVSFQFFDAPIYWWLAIAGALGFGVYNVVLFRQLIVVHKSGSPFDFRWWFQKDDGYVGHSFGRPSVGAQIAKVFHSTGRRDVFCFAWMLFGLAQLPQASALWFLAIGGGHGCLAFIHAFVGGMNRPAHMGENG